LQRSKQPKPTNKSFHQSLAWFTPVRAFYFWSLKMPEPTSSSVAGAAAAYKAFGGTAAAIASGATLAAVVVMLMTPPRTRREWAVGLISTVVSSVGGGAAVIQYFGLHDWVQSQLGLMAMGGLIFACGLPGWAIVRWVFNFIDKNREAGIDEIARDVKEIL
jgi:hypothetical protein